MNKIPHQRQNESKKKIKLIRGYDNCSWKCTYQNKSEELIRIHSEFEKQRTFQCAFQSTHMPPPHPSPSSTGTRT